VRAKVLPIFEQVREVKHDTMDPDEWDRLQKLILYENAARQQGCRCIAGIDEAGRGPLAGPVVAAACIVPPDVFFPGVNDSKKLSSKKRSDLFATITSHPNVHYALGIISHTEIDHVNIYQATILAMLQAVANLKVTPDFLLIDGNMRLSGLDIPYQTIVGGDGKSQSIAAASIIAKVTRDQIMQGFHQQWPAYGFDKHKGYPTKGHFAVLRELGPSPIHRLTFKNGLIE
jgi:ribonuclease HII